MIQSMTGYGKAVSESSEKTISVELRSLNSRQMDLSLRLPSFFRDKELGLRAEITKELERGKVDFTIYIDYRGEHATTVINKDLAYVYYQELRELEERLGESGNSLLEHILRMPEVLKPEKKEASEEEWNEVEKVVKEALKAIKDYRLAEGKTLEKDFTERIGIILKCLDEIERLDPLRVETIKTRIYKNLNSFLGKEQIDANRFEQEVIYYLEKIDITEEKVRLKMHCNYFLETMKEPSGGRKLNFISQEIGREINTIGSKANDAEIQKMVVLMKDELEKIKEQSMNIL